MTNSFEAYLITRGDSLHSMLGTLIWIISILIIIAFIASIVYIKVFDDTNNASDEDAKSALASSKIAIMLAIVLLLIIAVKSVTPKSEDMLIMHGIREITTEDMLKLDPMTISVLKERFPAVAQGLTAYDVTINQLNATIKYKQILIDSLTYEVNFYRNDSNIIKLR